MKSFKILVAIVAIVVIGATAVYAEDTVSAACSEFICYEHFFGVCVDDTLNPKLGFWRKQNNDTFYIDATNKYEGKVVILITPSHNSTSRPYQHILNDYPQIDTLLFLGYYDYYIEQYKQMFSCIYDNNYINNTNDTNNKVLEKYKDSYLFDYLIGYWKFFVTDMTNEPTEMGTLRKITDIHLDKYIKSRDTTNSDDNFFVTRLKWKADKNFYLWTGKLDEACLEWLKILDTGSFSRLQETLRDFVDLLTFENSSGCDSCVQKAKEMLIARYEKNKDSIYANFNKTPYIGVEQMLADYVGKYAIDTTIRDIGKEIGCFIKKQKGNAKDSAIYGYDADSGWYRKLNLYYDKAADYFAKDTTKVLGTIKDDATKLLIECGLKYNDRFEYRMEYYCYYSLCRLINGAYPDIKLIPILEDVVRMGRQGIVWPTFHKIEKEIAAVLIKKIRTESKPPEIKDIKTEIMYDGSIKITGNVINPDNINLLQIRLNKNKFVDVKIDGGKFSYTFPPDGIRKNDTNKITIYCKNYLGSVKEISINVFYKPTFADRKNIALLFACSEFDSSGLVSLPSVLTEVDSLKTYLYMYGFDTVIVRNPTKEEFHEKMIYYDSVFAERNNDYDQFLVLYAGHGRYRREEDKNTYLTFNDSKELVNGHTHYEIKHLATDLDDFSCKHIFFIADCCYSGTIAPNIASKPREDKLGGYNFKKTDTASQNTFGTSAAADSTIYHNNSLPGGTEQQPDAVENQNAIIKEGLESKGRLYITSGTNETTPERSELMAIILGYFSKKPLYIDFDHIKTEILDKAIQKKVMHHLPSSEANANFYFQLRPSHPLNGGE
ncbi:MAG: caspase family protein [Ignavibacteria bacterium]|nr:caspase family protein [Ignavibacteria bacterium]